MMKTDSTPMDNTISQTQELLKGAAKSTGNDPEFSVEAILAEYSVPSEATENAAPTEDIPPEPASEPISEPEPVLDPEPQPEEPPLPPAPEKEPAAAPNASRHISLETMVSSTVEEVLATQNAPASSRRPSSSKKKTAEFEPTLTKPTGDEITGPLWTPQPQEAETLFSGLYRLHRKSLLLAVVLFVVMLGLHLPAQLGWTLPLWSDTPFLQNGVFLLLQLLILICGNGMVARSSHALAEHRFPVELTILLANLVTLGDGVLYLIHPEDHVAAPLCLPAAALTLCALWGEEQKNRALRDSCRAAAISNDPYTVSPTTEGLCRQAAQPTAFYHYLTEPDLSSRWQSRLFPLLLIAGLAFAGLSSFGQGKGDSFLWCLSALLISSAGLSFPMLYGRTFAKVAERLKKGGQAIAGYSGARHISRSHRLIVTDSDLFPTGSLHFQGLKLFDADYPKAVSYAAALSREGKLTGYQRALLSLLDNSNAVLPPVEDFVFYEAGGFGGTIQGEKVLMGNEAFLQKFRIPMPNTTHAETDLFLAIDSRPAAAFSVRYESTEKVEMALHALRQNHLVPVLATRDPQITLSLLTHKFDLDAKLIYPDLAQRLALSEQVSFSGGRQICSLLYREGLSPLSEVCIAAHRMHRAIFWSSIFSLLGSVFSTFLSFYLCFVGAWELLSPLSLSFYLLLWTIPTLVLSENVTQF